MRERKQAKLLQANIPIQIFLPGSNAIPEFKAIEHMILNNHNPKDPSAIANDLQTLLKSGTGENGAHDTDQILTFAATYLKWMFKVI